ncbi:MAG: adenosylcobinamide-GDP ribazoletransferase [Ignisphaera sp.]
MAKRLRDFLSLLAFLTLLPIPQRYLGVEAAFGSLYMLPIVGFIRGLFAVTPMLLSALLHNNAPYVEAFSVVAMHYIIQGFIHADGFIDFSEAVLAHRFGVDASKVVKDRFRGSYAIAAFVLFALWLYSTMLQVIHLSADLWIATKIVLVAETWSPTSMAVVAYVCREPPDGLGKLFKKGLRISDIVGAFLASVLITYATFLSIQTGSTTSILVLLALAISAYTTSVLGMKTLGYANGDVLGFANELSYATILTTLALGVALWL